MGAMCQWSRDAPVHTNTWYLQLWLWSSSFLSERSFQKLDLRVVSDIALDCCTLPMNNEQWTSDIPHIPTSLQSPLRLAPNKLIGLPFILRLVNSASRENGIWVNRKLILTSLQSPGGVSIKIHSDKVPDFDDNFLKLKPKNTIR